MPPPAERLAGMTKTEMEPGVREQLLETALVELGREGREGISLVRVLGSVGVSAEEFGAEYASLDACLDAAYQQLSRRIDRAVRRGCSAAGSPGPNPPWPRRVWGGLEALLAELAAAPELARTLTRTYPSLGTEQQSRYLALVESFSPLLSEGRDHAGIAQELPGEVELLAVGAAEAIIFEEVSAGRARQLGTLGPSILFSLLVPFLGADQATAEMEKARY
jgi:AcrR family transcriptional regulator